MLKYYASYPDGLPLGKIHDSRKYIYAEKEDGVVSMCYLDMWPILFFKRHAYIDSGVIKLWLRINQIIEVTLPEYIEIV